MYNNIFISNNGNASSSSITISVADTWRNIENMANSNMEIQLVFVSCKSFYWEHNIIQSVRLLFKFIVKLDFAVNQYATQTK